MKKTIYAALAAIAAFSMSTSCIKVIEPHTNYVTIDQAAAAPGSFNNFVEGLTSSLVGGFIYGGTSNNYPYDYGYPTFYIMTDIMGQDMVPPSTSDTEWYQTWYVSGTGLGPQYAYCQVPLTYFYGWILDCNNVISMAGKDIPEDKKIGTGIAYAMRAFFYEDVARMYSSESYAQNPEALATVLQVNQDWSPYYVSDLYHNPRVTNKVMWEFIISDLDMAEELLKDYKRTDVYTPDLSVVYGMKARAYLEMKEWAKAKEYARKAIETGGYRMMTNDEYTSRENGFNSPNSSWMFGVQFKPNDVAITVNDSDSNWGSWMINEIDPEGSGCGYSSNYIGSKLIDRHLYETIPATDARKKCFVDFAIDDLGSKAEIVEALKAYSDYPEWVYNTGYEVMDRKSVGGIQLKFRAAGGDAGHRNQYVGFCVSVPIMRAEEMLLIEAEAAGMINEADGIRLLTAFAQARDPQFEYGQHNEAYGNYSTPAFQNECWWQRRVEFWGEGRSMYDIKRLGKGIIRSYPNTNHVEGYRWNTDGVPQWMVYCYVQTETNYNYSIEQNPTPIPPTEDSKEFNF